MDLLIQDTQYTPEEYAGRRGCGHGSTDYVTDVAVEAGARRVALFQHEPTHTDKAIDGMVEYSRNRAREVGSDLELFAAAEGKEVVL